MRKKLHKLLVTGGAGFIGSEFVRQAVKRRYRPVIVDKLTYAGSLERLKAVKGKYKFYKADICDEKKMKLIFKKEKPKFVVHFAAETHVDRSIHNATPFMQTNIKGTQILLDICREAGIEKFIHISTDEIYGEIQNGKFHETSPLNPNSPYSVSKAAADMLVRAYHRTYSLPVVIVRPCNNYGMWQYPEKLIPVAILKALKNEKIPVYGKGLNVREWLFVSDCAEVLHQILENGKVGEIYNIGSGDEKENIKVVKQILDILGKPQNLIEFVKDRPGHDLRYSLNTRKIEKEISWKAKEKFVSGLKKTIKWYISHREWMLNIHRIK